MPNNIGDKSNVRQELAGLPILKMIPLITAMSGAIGGLVVILTGADLLEKWTGFRIVWWQGMLIGAFFTGLAGWWILRTMIRDMEETSAVASVLGLERLDSDKAAQLEQKISRMLSYQTSLSGCYVEKKPGVTLVLGEATISTRTPGDTSFNSDGDRSQTILIAEFDDLYLPKFDLQPEHSALRILDRITGDQDIDFEDSQNFSQQFTLIGEEKQKVRQLFSLEVRTFLESFPGWTIAADKNRLAIFRSRKVVRPDDVKEFFATTSRMVDVFARNGQGIDVARIDQPLTMAETMGKADEVGGIIGGLLKRIVHSQVVDHADLNTALNSPVPRPIPQSLRRIWKADLFLIGICSVFLLAGIIVFLVGVFAQLKTQERLIACGIGLVVTLIFGSVIGIVKTLERRRFRLFSHGRILKAQIKSVQETAFVNGNDRVYKVFFQIGEGDRGSSASTKLQGIPAEQARRLAETGQTIRILQDRDVADRYLLADCYSLE